MLERLGRYEILETVAAGGQGTVYRARDGESGDVVALKMMHPGHTGEVQYLEALRQEANLASRLDHPNIVKVFDFQVEGGTAYVAMEYVPSVLRSEMQPGTPLSPGRAVELAIQVASAMARAHQHGVVHRDIKPQNILLTEDGTVKVTDFGIARAMQSSSIIRQTGVMGTPHYMSPEQWQGSTVDGRADVYSLGIVLYEMLTGSPPFEGDGMGEIFRKHEQEPVPPLPPNLADASFLAAPKFQIAK
jgi:serine/threonine-protein kinase